MTTLYTIYQITNIVNNKIYIGAHQTSDIDDGYMGSSKILDAAMVKYGRENFIKKILHEADDNEHMYLIEKEIVNENFVKRSDTYNIRTGGKGGWNHICGDPEAHKAALAKAGSSEVQEKRVAKHKKWFANLSDDDATKQKILAPLANNLGWKNQTKEQRDRANKTHSESIKGKNNPQFGKKWYINPITEKRRVCHPGTEPAGFVLSTRHKTRKVREYERKRIIDKRKR